ncbi:sigma 54-interacting transcriptional regulator [Mucilaginibacter gotjawali]|uniref:PAS domain S-box-containing protein n=2 Tax=Mucilaginibacter gotjawali TaxID=1550579 RepID=A0A839SA61_9SPHI|nr:sigma 54-interacting transcriptional regulator [Mucilaginibacter gotjawali]MBB3054252.1 PAS domain S-box-containing protein [Mucilaginibacter gotjawali]BAU51914.1 Formate hydrogenlyase transcriptional activator [Mucilaginibacter gotjawali]
MVNESDLDLDKDPGLCHYTFHNLYEAVFWADINGNILNVNDTASQMLGYSKEEFLAMNVTDIDTSDVFGNFAFFREKLKSQKVLNFESKHKHKKCNLYEVEVSCHYLFYKDREIICMFVRDISERKLAENQLKLGNTQLQVLLKESEERFRDLFEEAPIAYVHEGLDSRFIKANRAALRILGVRPDQVPYMYGQKMAPDTPDAQKRMKEAFESIGRGTDTSGVVLELRRQDNGAPIWIQWWSNPDKSGQFTRTMFLDITDRFLIEQEQAKLRAQNQYLQEEIKLNHNFEEIVSINKKFHKILQQIERVASTDAAVLILGESGTGKELLARAVHNISKRSKRPLIKINCANLHAELIESELFGHERGAFTGAMERKIGRFELADGGTIFLDEVGELPMGLQAKLLRVLQEGEFERLGSPKTIKVDVRVIAATNRNLEEAIEKKEFREDLFYRLNVFPVFSPPLRSRKEDIPLLVKHFVRKYESKMGREIKNIPDKVIDALMEYNWPGNIRELENIIERALILSSGDTLEYGSWVPVVKTAAGDENKRTALLKMDEVEKEHIINILNKTNWKVSGEKGAAKILGLNPNTLESRMKKLEIKREN